MRPIFDIASKAFGFDRSYSYDDTGHQWVGQTPVTTLCPSPRSRAAYLSAPRLANSPPASKPLRRLYTSVLPPEAYRGPASP